MLKKKINQMIYEAEFTDEELEKYCHYDNGDRYDYGTYGAGYEFNNSSDEQDCYDNRICEMIMKIKEYGATDIFNLAIYDDENKFNKPVINYLLSLIKSEFNKKWILTKI